MSRTTGEINEVRTTGETTEKNSVGVFQEPPANETEAEKKKRLNAERENYFRDLIERKYPALQQKGTGMKNAEARKRVERLTTDNFVMDPDKTSIAPGASKTIDDDPTVRELNTTVERQYAYQRGYYVQMAHKARRPVSNVPWFRIIGCETDATDKSRERWGTYLARKLHEDPNQRLTIRGIKRALPFMICVDERQQTDAGTDKRIKRLLSMYEREFYEQRDKFIKHRKTGLTEEEHKTRASFFAREQAWREAKKRHDVKEAEQKKTEDDEPKPQSSVIETPSSSVDETPSSKIELRYHVFPSDLKQAEFKFAVISYFRDLLAFERCFRDLSMSVDDADFQPIIIIWCLTETREEASAFCETTRCNHAFLQKHLLVVDTYQWIPLDHVDTHNIPITYANKYCNEVFSYKNAETRALEEYHQWERERYGEEAPYKEFDPKSIL